MQIYNYIIGLVFIGTLIIINPDTLKGKVVINYPENIYLGSIMVFIGIIILIFKYIMGVRKDK